MSWSRIQMSLKLWTFFDLCAKLAIQYMLTAAQSLALRITIKSSQRGTQLTFMTGVVMSGHFLRPPNMLTKFLETPKKYVDQFSFPLLKYQTDSEFETPNNYFLALKISDPKYVNLPSILDPKYFFSVLKISDPKYVRLS